MALPSTLSWPTLTLLFDMTGVFLAAGGCVLAAGRKEFDWLGVMVVAVVGSIGGSTLRDILLNRPVFWLEKTIFLKAILAGALGMMVWTKLRLPLPHRALLIADAISLAVFSVNGARVAETAGYGSLIMVVIGVITGVFGGVLRDVLCNDVPMILRRGSLYATTVIAGCSFFALVPEAWLARSAAAPLGMTIVLLMRLGSLQWGWRLPVFRIGD